MLGISTFWWHDRDVKGENIVRESLDMNFQGMELSYRMSDTTYREIKSALNLDTEILCIHNFFPKPNDSRIKNGSGDLFLLSSEDWDERSMAVNYSIKTIEEANSCECGAVILHLGRVEMPGPTEQLKELFFKGKTDSDEGLAFLKEQRHLRRSMHRKYLDNALFSLEKLNRVADKMSVFLGIENRYHFHEIPDFDEIGFILNEFKGSNIRYWHDVGHASVQENLGILEQKTLLDAYAADMLGLHIHDVSGTEDHLSPGQGEIDFNEIRPYIRPDCIKILEIHPEVEKETLEKGRDVILDALGHKENPMTKEAI